MSPAARRALRDALLKRTATAAARLALKGGTLIVSQADDGADEFIVSWRALTRCFATIESVEAWLDVFEGKSTR